MLVELNYYGNCLFVLSKMKFVFKGYISWLIIDLSFGDVSIVVFGRGSVNVWLNSGNVTYILRFEGTRIEPEFESIAFII